jgi:hypothetical protein
LLLDVAVSGSSVVVATAVSCFITISQAGLRW